MGTVYTAQVMGAPKCEKPPLKNFSMQPNTTCFPKTIEIKIKRKKREKKIQEFGFENVKYEITVRHSSGNFKKESGDASMDL